MTLQHAKQEWLKCLLTDPSTSIWDMAKWRKGRHSPWIPPVNGSTNLQYMGTEFENRFFNFPRPPPPVIDLPREPLPQ